METKLIAILDVHLFALVTMSKELCDLEYIILFRWPHVGKLQCVQKKEPV